jgi:hypothetical protein
VNGTRAHYSAQGRRQRDAQIAGNFPGGAAVGYSGDMRKTPLVMAGIFCGVLGGLALGAMVSPIWIGILAGVLFGGLAGAAGGIVMQREDARTGKRTRQLDDIIGITKGSLGVPRGSIPPGDLRRAPEEALELQSWAREWLTPPPPSVR